MDINIKYKEIDKKAKLKEMLCNELRIYVKDGAYHISNVINDIDAIGSGIR